MSNDQRRRYPGPPGDDETYWLPRDRDALDAAWDRYYDQHPQTPPTDTIPEPKDNAWDDIPF